MVGLVFTILQVATVEAQAPTAPPMGDPNAAPPMDGEDADLPPVGRYGFGKH